MERGGVPAATSGAHRKKPRRRGRKKGPPGLKVSERDGHWHVTGTLRAKGHSRRVRKSTELPAIPATWDAAQACRREWEGELIHELAYGARSTVPLAIAADQFLSRRRKRPMNDRDVRIVQEISARFGSDKLASIPEGDWIAFVDARNANNTPETRERYITGVCSFLNWCRRKPRRWLAELPEFERDEDARKPKHRRARRIADFTPELIMLMLEQAAPHLAGQLIAEWSTGARVSSVLWGCRICDLLVTGSAVEGWRGQLTFHETKNGEPTVASLHPWAAERLLKYLEWRGDRNDREAPLFVTPRKDRRTGKKIPYSDRSRGQHGGQNKTAFRAMKRRTLKTLRRRAVSAARILRDAGDLDGARQALAAARAQRSLIRQVTQHWFRHLLATSMMAKTGDLRSTMEQGGWLDANSVMAYTHDVPEMRRRIVESLDIGAAADAPTSNTSSPAKENSR